MNLFRFLLLLATLPLSLLFATDLTDTLTTEEFESAGLQKLTPEELANLNALWNRQNEAEQPPAPASSSPAEAPKAKPSSHDDLVGKEQVAVDVSKAPKKIESRIVGTFNGWYGETVFHLENGQVWQQRITDVQKYSPTENPKVTVQKSLGGYRLRIDGYRQTCPVKRIK